MDPRALLSPDDPPERQTEKLLAITAALMRRVEQATDDSGAAYAQFQRAALLEEQVGERTRDLEHALDLLNQSNARLAEANRATEAARQNLANAIETIQEGFALFDSAERMVMCNARFSNHLQDIRPHLRPGLAFADYVHHVSRSRFLALPEGETPEDWAVRRMRRHHDRHVIFNVRVLRDQWLQVSEHRTADGGTVILQTDVTEIIRMERYERGKLLDDQARIIRATLEHISQGVCIFDAERHLVGWNERLASLLATPLTRFRKGASFDYLADRFGQETSFGQGMTAERLADWTRLPGPRPPLTFEIRREGGLILDVSAQEMPDRGFVMSFTDVTAERGAVEALKDINELLEQRVMERTLELEDALAKAERANATRARFVAAASHDLLQPLSAAKLFISSIADDGVSSATRARLEKAENALESVEGILDALLDISKLESGAAAVDICAVPLAPLLAKLSDEFGPLAARKGLDLRILPAAVLVESDPSYLRRILQNLIGNAIRYTQSGRVLVGARRHRGTVRLEIWDTGPGIAEEDQDAIFREFHRLNARASASEGMGLGLAIVERACALLGHPLGLWSEPGRGTRFAVSLPRATGGGAPAEGMRPAAMVGVLPAPQNRIVFLVENDLDLRRAMCLLLEKWGNSVLDVRDAEEGLALLDELGILPDAFLVDYQLGEGASGIELIEALRARYGQVEAVLVTADRSAAVREACAAREIPLMQKPIDARALERFLDQLPPPL